ncbi:MAG: hypothetical protein ABIS38_03700, partial [Sphingomicrobium sp.]
MTADAPRSVIGDDSHHLGARTDLGSRGIGLLTSRREAAQAAAALLRQHYDFASDDQATSFVALGGDGFMLHTLH